MGGSQSQETPEAGGTSPVKSPAQAVPTTGGGSTTDAAAAASAATSAAASAKPVPVPKPAGETKGGVEKSNKQPPPGTQICVQNLGKDTKAEVLRKKFEGFGKIVDVSLETQKNGPGKGFGLVTFATQEEAKKAIEAMNHKPQPDGKPLLVTFSAQKPGEVKGKKDQGEKGEKGKGKGWPSPLPPGMLPTSKAPSAPSRTTAGAGEKPKKEVPTGTQICVRNVAKDAKEEDLRKQFEGFGKITEVSLKTLKNGQGKGYGFVTFASLKEAKKAIEVMHEKPTADGKQLLVTMATRQPAEAKGKGKEGGEKGDKGKGKGSQICVRNLLKDAKEDDLRKLFQGFGKITDVSLKTLPDGQGKGYGFVTFTTLQEAQRAIEAMHEKSQPGGKPLLVTMGTRQPGDAKGKGKEGEKGEKGKGKGSGPGKGQAEAQPGQAVPFQPQMPEGATPVALAGQFPAPLGYYPYSQEQIQNAWAMRMQYYQQALQAQAYYTGFTAGVVPNQAAMSASTSSMRESPAPAPAAPTWNREYAAPAQSLAPSAPAPAPAWGKEYIGQVKSISSKNGYGFITCNETKAAYGRDVFVDAALLPEIEVKAKVSFTMELSAKGHPRAIKVTKIADAED